MRIRKLLLATLAVSTLLVSGISWVGPANAQASGINIDFAGAEPTTYDHATGGGKWGSGTVNVDIERSLEGEDFACGDKVSFLTQVKAQNTPALQALGAMSVDLSYTFTMDSTGQSGVALAEPVSVELTTGDSGNVNDGNSSVSTLETTTSGTIFTQGSLLGLKIRLTDLEAGETVIIRTTVSLKCQFGSSPTGNLQAKFASAALVSPAEAISGGAKTVDLKSADKVSKPELQIAKTVTTQGGTCPGLESITIEPNETVRYCYEVTNPSNSGGRLGAPLFNLSNIFDDSGKYPDFEVSLMSGLTDEDMDGQADDLAAGATAYAYKELAFDGDKDSTITNIASISGFDAPSGGNQISDSDSATVFVDAPEFLPAITVTKLTNGSDGPSILVGSTVNWTYEVSNTGNVALTAVSVSDDKGVTVTCPKTTLAVGESMTCTGSGTATAGDYSNLATASGTFETQVVSATDPSSYFGANPVIQIEKTPDTQVVIEGEKANFSIAVTNTGNVPLNTIVVVDPLSTACAYTAASLAVAETVTYTCASDAVSAGFTNTATVTALWNSTSVTDSDTATVTVDFLPKISVAKDANKSSVPESGGDVTFTVSVTNDAVESFTLNSLVDDKFGDLNGIGTCAVPQTIFAGGTYSCTFTKLVKGEFQVPHVNTVTATGVDPEGHSASDSDDASVDFTDVLPDISLTKVANPTAAKWTGDFVDYSFTITNVGPETLTVTAFSDDRYTLSSECLALITQVLAPGGSVSCVMVDVPVSGVAGGSLTNTATVTGVDNELNSDSATASATVNFWWYGRTPGYWKNHPEAWINGYTRSQSVVSVFNIPSALLTSGILNLDKSGGQDSLIDALGYKGGSTLSGGAQILLRAAVAALLNKAYYGSDYPVGTSTTDLISQVNTVLATGSRSAYVTFGSYLDYWNNAVHAALP